VAKGWGYVQTDDAIRRIVGDKQVVSLIELVTTIQAKLKPFIPKLGHSERPGS
jgi:hypothetical protein